MPPTHTHSYMHTHIHTQLLPDDQEMVKLHVVEEIPCGVMAKMFDW